MRLIKKPALVTDYIIPVNPMVTEDRHSSSSTKGGYVLFDAVKGQILESDTSGLNDLIPQDHHEECLIALAVKKYKDLTKNAPVNAHLVIKWDLARTTWVGGDCVSLSLVDCSVLLFEYTPIEDDSIKLFVEHGIVVQRSAVSPQEIILHSLVIDDTIVTFSDLNFLGHKNNDVDYHVCAVILAYVGHFSLQHFGKTERINLPPCAEENLALELLRGIITIHPELVSDELKHIVSNRATGQYPSLEPTPIKWDFDQNFPCTDDPIRPMKSLKGELSVYFNGGEIDLIAPSVMLMKEGYKVDDNHYRKMQPVYRAVIEHALAGYLRKLPDSEMRAEMNHIILTRPTHLKVSWGLMIVTADTETNELRVRVQSLKTSKLLAL